MIILEPWQVDYLNEHGMLTVLVPMEPQPEWKRDSWGDLCSPMDIVFPDSHYHNGDIVDVLEPWGVWLAGYCPVLTYYSDDPNEDPYAGYLMHTPSDTEAAYKLATTGTWSERPAKDMPSWAVRTRLTILAIEPMHIKHISEELAEECGYKFAVHGPYDMRETAREQLREYYERDNGTDRPWAWIYRLKKEGE